MIDRQTLRRGASHLVLASVLTSLALAGCKPNGAQTSQTAASSAPAPLAALPLATGAAPTIAPAPTASALPPAPPANVGQLADPSNRYAFADRAYAMTSAFGDAPPDYAFDYGAGERPWVWRGDDQSTRVAEPLPGGGERYYYYEPGSTTPYLVRDPDYSYGYDNGTLVVVYDRSGRALQPNDMRRRADVAGRFLARAQALYAASQQQQRQAVAEANWAARRSAIDADRAQWAADQAEDQDWRAYHQAHQDAEDSHWDDERYRREAQAARFAEAINDAALAQQDWQAAHQAQDHAHGPRPGPGAGPGPGPGVPPPSPPPAPPPQQHEPGGPPKPPAFTAPPAPASAPPQHVQSPPSGGPGDHHPPGGPPNEGFGNHHPQGALLAGPSGGRPNGPGEPHGPPPAGPGHPSRPALDEHKADAARQAAAQADAAHQAQLKAAMDAEAARKAQAAAQLHAQSLQTQANAQAEAAKLAAEKAQHHEQHAPPPSAAGGPRPDIVKPPPGAPPKPPVHAGPPGGDHHGPGDHHPHGDESSSKPTP